MTPIQYRADIDGLRAIAVLVVLVFHAKLGIAPGGFIGVDVFFVISGYLITSIILAEMSQGRFALAGFYERRIRRIFPALFTVIAASAFIGWHVLPPPDYKAFASSAMATAAFASNFYFNRQTGYFAPAAETQPLLHTWSLGVEEQFYILAPFFLILLMGRLHRFKVPLLAGILAASLAISAYGVEDEWPSAFYLLPSRAFELMIGMALALGLVPRVVGVHARQALGLIGLGFIAFGTFFFTGATPFPGLAALVPCVGTAFVIHSGTLGDTWTHRLLAAKPMVLVGKISYSLYLWHWPLLAFAQYEFGERLEPLHRIGLLGLAFVLAWFTYVWIEQPARRGAVGRSRKHAFAGGIAIVAICLAASQSVRWLQGVPTRLPPEAAAIAFDMQKQRVRRSEACNNNPGGDVEEVERACPIGSEDSPASFVVWGDSHAMSLLNEIPALAKDRKLAGYAILAGGCPPLFNLAERNAHRFRKCLRGPQLIRQLTSETAIGHVIIAARWGLYAEGQFYRNERNSNLRRLVDGSTAEPFVGFPCALSGICTEASGGPGDIEGSGARPGRSCRLSPPHALRRLALPRRGERYAALW